MNITKFLIIPLVFVILLVGFAPLSYSSEESEAREDIQAGCRDGNTLVFRYAYKDYVCVSPDTAKRWAELGLAEIYQEFTPEKQEKKPVPLKPQFNEQPATPPPKKTTSSASDTSECRDGYSLVFRFIHGDTFCTSPSTAASWERLGLAEILVKANEPQITESSSKVLPEKEMVKEEYTETEVQVEKSVETEKKIQSKQIVPEQTTKTKSSTKFILPGYPDQPTIHPKIIESNDFWTPPEVHNVNQRIWVAVGYDTANSIMIEGEKGIIIVDTLSSYESAKKVLSEFRKITDKPIKTIIYTHGSPDHVQGAKAFLEEGDGNVEIIAHERLLDFYLTENGALGTATAIRSTFASGLLLPDEGRDQRNLGVFPPSEPGTPSFIPPTHVFSTNYSLDISGIKMELFHESSDKSDKIYIWLPDDETLLTGDFVYGVFPNIGALTGNSLLEPKNYIKTIDHMISLEPQFFIPSHTKPVSDPDEINTILITVRDATQYIYDQTIRGINNGFDVDELSTMITLPSWFEDEPWVMETRGQIPWHVKQIYYNHLGWFQGDSKSLLSLTDSERSKKIVAEFGGNENILKKIKTAIENSEYEWAVELASYVLEHDPENSEAKSYKAYALRILGQKMISSDARNWLLTSALELEDSIKLNSNEFTKTNLDQISEIPIEHLLKILPTKLNPENVSDSQFILNLIYTDTQEEFTMNFRNGILIITGGLSTEWDEKLFLDTQTHKLILLGDLDLNDAVRNGLVTSEGDDEFQEWLENLEPIAISSFGIRD